MDANLELLEQQVDDAISNYEDRRRVNRRKSSNVAVANASMAAVTTVLIALSSVYKPAAVILITLAIVASALVTIVSGWDALFNHKKLWVLYTDKWILMKELRSDIFHFKTGGGKDQQEINSLYDRYKTIIRGFNDEWKDLRHTAR